MKASNVYSKTEDLECVVCGKNLFDNPGMSMINIVQDTNSQKIMSVKPCCKGKCDQAIKARSNHVSGWKDLSDFTNPYLYMKHIMSVLNSMYDGEGFDNKDAFESYKDLLLKVYPYVARDMSEEESQTAVFNNAMPF